MLASRLNASLPRTSHAATYVSQLQITMEMGVQLPVVGPRGSSFRRISCHAHAPVQEERWRESPTLAAHSMSSHQKAHFFFAFLLLLSRGASLETLLRSVHFVRVEEMHWCFCFSWSLEGKSLHTWLVRQVHQWRMQSIISERTFRTHSLFWRIYCTTFQAKHLPLFFQQQPIRRFAWWR